MTVRVPLSTLFTHKFYLVFIVFKPINDLKYVICKLLLFLEQYKKSTILGVFY